MCLETSRRIVELRMPGYLYELHRGSDLVATGHLPVDQTLEPGDTLKIGEHSGTIQEIRITQDEPEPRIIVRLDP